MNFKQLLSRYTAQLAVCALVIGYVGQINYDTWRRYGNPKLNITYNEFIEPQPLSGETAKLASFGAEEFLADWYWLTLIQYYGGGDPYGKYRKLAELFHVVTDLSPRFTAAYQTGLLILPGEGFVDEALKLSDKGKLILKDKWEIPYYTGLIYHIYKKDYVKAAKEFEQAAALPSAPPNAKLFAGIYYNKAEERQTAYQIFKTIYESTDDEFTKERSRKYVGHLEIVFILEDAALEYKNRFGSYPKTLEELVSSKILVEIPISPLGASLTINPETGRVLETKR